MFKEGKITMTLKVEKSLKDTFQKICKDKDTTASQELRKFMRWYVQENSQAKIDFGEFR